MTASAHGAALPTAPLAIVAVVAVCCVGGLAVVAQVLTGMSGSASGAPSEIPTDYLVLYHAASGRYRLAADGWSLLAAVGKVECDHGRSLAVGCGRGERNAAGAMGPAQFLAGTWARYGVDGDGDGDRDVWDPRDAIFGMANYLHASGAPGDWRRALFAYNHSGSYVDAVLAQAAQYRSEGVADVGAASTSVVPFGDVWLAALPGFPGERCDARIVRDVVVLSAAFGLRVSDCFGGAPHAIGGEHPLGLAIDAEPVDGDWDRTLAFARVSGWTEACAAQGCPGRGPFRVVLYNGFPSHGDPDHSDTPHIHVSWQHAPAAPFTPAPWVRTLTVPSLATTSPPIPGGGR